MNNRFSLNSIREAEPEFIELCQSIIRARWRRALRLIKLMQLQRSTVSIPVLRPDDMAYLQAWDGLSFNVSAMGGFDALKQFLRETLDGEPRPTATWMLVWERHCESGPFLSLRAASNEEGLKLLADERDERAIF